MAPRPSFAVLHEMHVLSPLLISLMRGRLIPNRPACRSTNAIEGAQHDQ
jgi:hypothetical protein